MFTSYKQPQRSHKKAADEQQPPTTSVFTSAASARRASWQQQSRVPPYYQRDEPLLLLDGGDDEDGEQNDEDDEHHDADWRSGAQMLTERDEMLLLNDRRRRRPRSPPTRGADVLDAAPVNRRRSPTSQSAKARQKSPPPPTRTTSSHAGAKLLFGVASAAPKAPTSQKSKQRQRDYVEMEEPEVEHQDDNSSMVSFAQSGCHSILSAWRLKSANRAARSGRAAAAAAAQPPRPTSVLSQASSANTAKKSVASTAYTLASRLTARAADKQQSRIQLGPKSAQHFVTNSRRRRRANELILNTLEARRRALSLNRSNLPGGGGGSGAGSLFGSESFLVPGAAQLSRDSPDVYQRLSLARSPSPATGHRSPGHHHHHLQLHQLVPASRKSPSGALSDLGGRMTPIGATAAGSQQVRAGSKSSLTSGSRPPLAKLDQNSSDLCSSNDSTSGGDSSSSSSSSSSSGSQFTQLVTSELAAHDLGQRYLPPPQSMPAATGSPAPPKVPARTRRETPAIAQHSASRSQAPAQVRRRSQEAANSSDDDDLESAVRFRRGAMKRDSVRRMRMNHMNRKSVEPEVTQAKKPTTSRVRPTSAMSTASKSDSLATGWIQPLSRERRLEIENNPFLQRQNFRRTFSLRSSAAPEVAQHSPEEPRGEDPLRASARTRREARKELTVGKPTTSAGSEAAPPREQVRQVERMLRQMSPGQEVRSQVRSQEQHLVSTAEQSRPADLIVAPTRRVTRPPPEVATRRSQLQTVKSPEPEVGKQKPNEFKTTTRLVREGARSSDDLKFDLAGNRRARELDERWRHERIESPRAGERQPDGSIVWRSSQLETSRRREVISSSTGNISPPAEFSDSPPPSSSSRVGQSMRSLAHRAQSEERPPPATLARPAPPPRVHGRVESSARARPAQLSGAGSSTAKSSSRVVQPALSLPKFERTADDEFRKRVDQLRQMARANVAAAPTSGAKNTTSSTTTKPLSLNWDKQQQKPKERPQLPVEQTKRESVTSTDLDDMLLADRYQRPLATPTWRRSNSSLGSLGASRSTTAAAAAPSRPEVARRPLSPPTRRPASSVLSQSILSVGPRPEEQTVPVRLVVREKAAPKLDFAIVEKQPQVQRLTQVTTTSVPKPIEKAAPASLVHTLRPTQQQQQQQRTGSTATPTAAQQQRAQMLARARLSSASPRSPEFGSAAGANSSSADDSAIASSVSSPSLSFVTGNGSGSPPRPSAATAASQTIMPARQLPGLRVAPISASVDTPTTSSTGGALQSILRRQQQQQQQLNENRASSTSCIVPLGSSTTSQTSQTMLTKTTTTLSSQPVEVSPVHQDDDQHLQVRMQSYTPAGPTTKRVHFNDRTSVRSFESLSSENSNSTAINQTAANQQQIDRNLIGSPDSMGSGSTSRLSCESPDFRRGAAIYAIRGDPELEQQQQQQQVHVQPLPVGYPQLARSGPMSPPTHLNLQQQPAMYSPASGGQPMVMSPVRYATPATSSQSQYPVAVSIAQQQFNQRQQQQQPASQLSIRMTAPPAIGQSSPISTSGYLTQVAPRPATSMLTSPVMYQQQQRRQMVDEDDDMDPDYALRLRQAAISRVFTFANMPPPPAPPTQSGGVVTQVKPSSGGGGGGGGSSQMQRRAPLDLSNFQTEV